jgi:hypothetical protein
MRFGGDAVSMRGAAREGECRDIGASQSLPHHNGRYEVRKLSLQQHAVSLDGYILGAIGRLARIAHCPW